MSREDGPATVGRLLKPPDPPVDTSDDAAVGMENSYSVGVINHNVLSDFRVSKVATTSACPTTTPSSGLAEEAKTARTAAWTPSDSARVRGNLAESNSTVVEAAAVMQRYYTIATAEYPLHEDTALRSMTKEEKCALQAYLERKLELPAPPTFLTCTTPAVKRTALLVYHHTFVEATLIADVPAQVRLGKHVPRRSLLREIAESNATNEVEKQRMKAFMQDAQRIVSDGRHTLSFTFMTRQAAGRWAGIELKLRGCVLKLHWSDTSAPGVKSSPQVARQYAIRILETDGLNALHLHQVFDQITGEPLLDLRHSGARGLREHDNDYWTIIFGSLDCPTALEGVTSIIIDGRVVLLHHFQRTTAVPCRRCYSTAHRYTKCPVPTTQLTASRASRQRKYVGTMSKMDCTSLGSCENLESLDAAISAMVATLSNPGTTQPSVVLERLTTSELPAESGDVVQSALSTDTTSPDGAGWTVVRRNTISTAPGPVSGRGLAKPTTERDSKRSNTRLQQRGKNRDKNEKKKSRSAGSSTTTITSRQTRVTFAEMEAEIANERNNKAGGVANYPNVETEPTVPLHGTLGRYGVLADDDSDEVSDGDESMAASNVNDSDADESMEEAPYAYERRDNITNVDVMEVDAESSKKTERREDDQEGDCRAKKSRRGSGIPHTTSHSESKAIDSNSQRQKMVQRTITDFSDATSLTPTPSSVTRAEGKIPDSPTSDEEFTMGAPHAGTDEGDQDSPIQLMHWLARFNGRPVEVDTNGQCAMLAMHATTLNYDGQVLPKSAKITKGANKLKRLTYTIMMANLRKDVELGLVDPVRELKRLHPDRTITDWVASATAVLFAHYAKNEIDP